MTPSQTTPAPGRRQDFSRWPHDQIARAFDHFSDPDCDSSQRQYARQHGIPRSTLGFHLRREAPDGVDPELAAFLRSSSGRRFLRRILLALFLVFAFRAAAGLRMLGLFLRYCQLDRFVASSVGALHDLAGSIQDDLLAYAREERVRLAEGVPRRDIAVIPDEHFHGDNPCLVAIEPVSNFILVERYGERRDAQTWTDAINAATAELPVTVRLVSSDQARGLIACARTGLGAEHLPELFHGQRDLARPFMGPLGRQKEAAEKDLQHAKGMTEYWQKEKEKAEAGPPRPGRPVDFDWRIRSWQADTQRSQTRVRASEDRLEQARQGVRGIADDYHPFDGQTGQPVSAGQMEERLRQRMQSLQEVAEQGQLPARANEAVEGGRTWVVTLVAVLGWFWSMARRRIAELDLPEEAERMAEEKLLAGLYWEQAARRGRTAEERKQKEELAGRLLEEARAKDSGLGRMPEEGRREVERVAREVVGLFARSSSCVEGRNGRLSLFHHGQCRLSASRLAALTVVHNYVSERADGTTAAERFFGKKPRDAFSWLLQRMPELPRPAARRPANRSQTASDPV